MKATVDRQKCIGCGMCTQFAGEIFEMVDTKAKVKKGAEFEKNKKEIKDAKEMCPVEAIEVK